MCPYTGDRERPQKADDDAGVNACPAVFTSELGVRHPASVPGLHTRPWPERRLWLIWALGKPRGAGEGLGCRVTGRLAEAQPRGHP